MPPAAHVRRGVRHPQHGNGVWAPQSVPTTVGTTFTRAIPTGASTWSAPRTRAVCGRSRCWSRPPGESSIPALWDDDGRAYLVHGWAGSRAGFNSILTVSGDGTDGSRLVGEEVLIFRRPRRTPDRRGPKFLQA